MKRLGVPECPRPPRGWFCTRPANHVGPCAATPYWWNVTWLWYRFRWPR